MLKSVPRCRLPMVYSYALVPQIYPSEMQDESYTR